MRAPLQRLPGTSLDACRGRVPEAEPLSERGARDRPSGRYGSLAAGLLAVALLAVLSVGAAARPTGTTPVLDGVASSGERGPDRFVLRQHGTVAVPSEIHSVWKKVSGFAGTQYMIFLVFEDGTVQRLWQGKILDSNLPGHRRWTNMAWGDDHDHEAHAQRITYERAQLWTLSTGPVSAEVVIGG